MAELGDVINYLKRNGVPYEVIEHAPAFSAHEVAVASNVPDKGLAKTIIINTNDKYFMMVIPGDHRLEEFKLHDLMKAKDLHLAHEDDLKPLFPDCELGAMPPFGNLYALPVYIDKELMKEKEIIFNACSHTKSIRLKMEDYMQLVKPVIAEFSCSRYDTKKR